jgi:maltose O-acetyltransferase
MSLADRRTAVWLRRCRRVGANTRARGRPTIYLDGGTITIGANCTIDSRPVATHFVAGPGAILSIEDDVFIGHGSAIAAYERVRIGAGTKIGAYAIVMDTNFHSAAGDQSVSHDCRPVDIGRACRIGVRVTLTRGVQVGDGACVLAGSVVATNVPARTCVAGARARVIGDSPSISWDSARAVLPFIVMDACRLDAPVDLALTLPGLMAWDGAAFADLVSQSIAAYFGVAVTPAELADGPSLGEIAARIEERRMRR